jgi:uncharacterized protein YdaL
MSTPINYTVRQGDTARVLNYNLTLAGAAIDLSAVTNVILTINDGDSIFQRTASIVSAASGSVSYNLQTDDVAKAGCHFMDFTINYVDGTILRVPTVGHIIMDVKTNSYSLSETSGL